MLIGYLRIPIDLVSLDVYYNMQSSIELSLILESVSYLYWYR